MEASEPARARGAIFVAFVPCTKNRCAEASRPLRSLQPPGLGAPYPPQPQSGSPGAPAPLLGRGMEKLKPCGARKRGMRRTFCVLPYSTFSLPWRAVALVVKVADLKVRKRTTCLGDGGRT